MSADRQNLRKGKNQQIGDVPMKTTMVAGTMALGLVLSATVAKAAEPITIEVRETEPYGEHLIAEEEHSIYLFTGDRENESTCYDACALAWPPVLSEGEPVAGEGVDAAKLGTTERKDETLQVTYNGAPLYYFIQDSAPGDTTGQRNLGFGGAWHLVSPDGEKIEEE
jgi:predicted lipoprotein with Yx(FWY)xxD motif